jgi:hypothetical protein
MAIDRKFTIFMRFCQGTIGKHFFEELGIRGVEGILTTMWDEILITEEEIKKGTNCNAAFKENNLNH